ncbi:MAG: hypothetical protein F6K00_19780 [Leptolyngbya sp. SIOISBB]|nr:hypothetical protein [Leptolyngbya sp. SIOISBB]
MVTTPLYPKHPHGKRLAEIFNYGWKWLSTPNDGGRTAWTTNDDYPLKPRTLWKRWQDMTEIIGVRFGRLTRYAMLDIDAGSEYLEMLPQIKMALETIGIVRTIFLRSSWSGGLHIYIPLPAEFSTFSVACGLRQCLEAQGFVVANGQLEIFPNEKAYSRPWRGEKPTEYNGHRLPLQPHSGACLLDDDLQSMGNDIAVFWAMWDNAVVMNDAQDIMWALSTARNNRRKHRRQATGPAQEWQQDLEAIIREGWTGPGQTNKILKEIATYGRVFEKLSGHELIIYIATTAFDCPGYLEHCQHKHEIERRCRAWGMAVEKYYWPLGDEPLRERKSFGDICQQRANDARDRIADAVKWLRQQMQGFNIKQMVAAICREARCSPNTLYKNRDLWHPDGEKPSEGVTPSSVSDPAELEAVQRQVRESLESVGAWEVTPKGGRDEVYILKSPHLKNLSPEGEKRGCGGEKGLSTGWSPLNGWKEGGVDDV